MMLSEYVINHFHGFLLAVLKRTCTSYLFVCALLVVNHSIAQNPLPLNFETLTINDGLSQGFISSIAQDKKGLMWFGTSDGLNKYDGYTFTIYHHDPNDTTSLASDDITAVYEDSKERLWILTRHNGMDLFDREHNIFRHFRHTGFNSLQSDNMLSIAEDKTGALWIRTNQGIDRFTDDQAASLTPSNGDILSGNKIVFQHINIDIIYESVKNRFSTPYIFVDSWNHILLSTIKNIWELDYNLRLNSYRLIKRYTFKLIDPDHLPMIIEDPATNNIYINNKTVLKVNNLDFYSAKIIYKNAVGQASLTIDKHNRLWMSDTNKIIQVNLKNDKIEKVLTIDPALNKSLNVTTAFFTDRTGVVWIATGGYGVLKYNPEVEQFHHILSQSNIYQLVESSPGKIITNNMLALTIKKDSPLFIQKLVSVDLIKKYFPKNTIVSFTNDTAGNIFIAAHAVILEYNLKTKVITSHPLPKSDQASLPFPLFADKKNNIWMGYNRNFIRYNITSEKFTKFNYPIEAATYEYDFLQYIFEDDNNLWLGSINGLFRLNTIDNTIRHYTYQQADTNSLSNNFVLSIYNDTLPGAACLWIGTKGGGLNRFDKITGKFTNFNTTNGLANNVVYGILPDDEGNLWLSTNKGLSTFNPETKQFRNFDISDGLQSNEFNRYAFCKTKDGILVFGGLNGINYFNPKDIKPLEPPDVLITDFRLFNKNVDFKDPGSPFRKNISFIEEVSLKYEQNVITFQFAAMDYRKAGNARYRYRMEGFDKDWIYSGTVREATYTNLNPGHYRFIVQGTFGNGSWGKKLTFLRVIVIVPWYQSWWFYLILAVVTVSLTYALYRYRLNQLTKLEMLRNRIARDLHDEVGSSISTIAIYSKIVHEHLGNLTFNNESLMKKITENAHEIMESMNDIVWNINAKNDAFEHIISRMREHAHQLLEAKGYTLYFNFDENLYKMKLPMEKRRDFYLIYKEALNNIAKYAGGTNVWITLVMRNANIDLTIKDDGRGFDITTVRKNSNGLTNMNFRTNALNGKITITSEPGKGTEIRMSF